MSLNEEIMKEYLAHPEHFSLPDGSFKRLAFKRYLGLIDPIEEQIIEDNKDDNGDL